MLALKPAYPNQVKLMTTSLPDDSKRRRLSLQKQQVAYKIAMADCSQIYDGRDMLPDYSSKARDSDALRAELKALSSFYRPVKNSQEPNRNGQPTLSNMADTKIGKCSQREHSDSPTALLMGDSKASIALSQSDYALQARQQPESKPCDASSTTLSSEDSDSSASLRLIRRKKSSPQHRCIDKNLNLSGIIKPPRYLPSELGDQLTSSLRITRDEKFKVDTRLTKSMVEFRANVEVYCYSL